ncbi:hypothetical protein QQG55_28405 [Brugia pahangi]
MVIHFMADDDFYRKKGIVIGTIWLVSSEQRWDKARRRQIVIIRCSGKETTQLWIVESIVSSYLEGFVLFLSSK